jgi:hypothetical protein
VRIEGTGRITLPGISLSGRGEVRRSRVTGAGHLQFPAFALDGAGSIILAGTAALLMPAVVLSATGRVSDPPFWAAEEEWLLGLTDEIDALERM